MTGVNGGMTYTISVVFIEAAAPYGYTETQGGICATVIIIAGFVGGCK